MNWIASWQPGNGGGSLDPKGPTRTTGHATDSSKRTNRPLNHI